MVTATTSMEDFTFHLVNLCDGDLQTEWSSVPTGFEDDEQTITVDLKREWSIGEIQLKPAWGGSDFPVDFEILVLENEKWVSVYKVTDYKKPVDESIQRFQFEQRKISQFKIVVTKMSSEASLFSVKLAEIMAYPFATGDDFDLDAVQAVTNTKDFNAAETLGQSAKEQKEGVSADISVIKIVIGAVCVLISIAGTVVMMLIIKKSISKFNKEIIFANIF